MWLITSDLHLTVRPEHAYRWEFMDWLYPTALQNKVQGIFILGDISDAKDNHNNEMVNKTVTAIRMLSTLCPVHILFGNHDGPSRDRPYWKFLRDIPNVRYYTQALDIVLDVEGTNGIPKPVLVLFCPWGEEATAFEKLKNPRRVPDYMFMHTSANGVRLENGTIYEGETPAKFLPPGCHTKVYSGDIHVPQTVGDIEYVGAPYHVHFGDPFEGRVVLLDPLTRQATSLHPPGMPRLHSLKLRMEDLVLPDRLRPGDRVKIEATTERQLMPEEWQTYVRTMRDKCADLQVELTGARLQRQPTGSVMRAPSAKRSDEAIVRTYSSQQKYDESLTAAGVELLKDPTP